MIPDDISQLLPLLISASFGVKFGPKYRQYLKFSSTNHSSQKPIEKDWEFYYDLLELESSLIGGKAKSEHPDFDCTLSDCIQPKFTGLFCWYFGLEPHLSITGSFKLLKGGLKYKII